MRGEPTASEQPATMLSIEFLLSSGETFTVRAFAEGATLADAVSTLGQSLAAEIGTDRVNTFAYGEEDDYFFDAVSMRNVVAFSISPYDEELEDDDDYEDDGR